MNTLPLRRAGPSIIALGAALLGTAAITSVLHARVEDVTERPGRGAMPVETVVFEPQDSFLREQTFLGVVKAATRSDIGFEVEGVIAGVSVSEGASVAAGDVLARLDTRSLMARRDAASASVAQVAAELELARARVARQSPLAGSGAISAQSFDDTRLGEKALAARLAAARAELKRLDIELDKSTLRAPFAARIGRQHLDQGSVTGRGAPMFTLIDTAAREAQIGVTVEQAEALEIGAEYRLTLREHSVSARLRAVRPDVSRVSLTAAAIFELPDGLLSYDGEPVSVALPRRIEQRGGWLPLSALLEGDRGVWTVLALRERDSRTVALREVVEVLHVSGERAYVRGTLKARDRIVGDGVHRVAPGTRVLDAHSQQLAGA
ncbi:MAG: efflux RND transporter periplasmic adaptor subunit [Halieaceae bacterium]|jgi:RND family efflux transporter MFP subunit|nr:efflux RND transporter periplasmic adaptor subunit [Halieaceae bacterium]